MSLSDLQKITDLWVSLLWSLCDHSKPAFEKKVQEVSKYVLYEPVFILKLVKAIHFEVSLVVKGYVGKSVFNQFTSGILYFFRSPVRDYFQ